jgi:hypothetical protein
MRNSFWMLRDEFWRLVMTRVNKNAQGFSLILKLI